MSFSGNKTPLQLNAESQLNNKQGLRINPTASTWQGIWIAGTPYNTPTTSSYTQGSLTAGTVLNYITAALPNFYNLTPSTLSVSVWRNLLTIGRPANGSVNCPALGNARPAAFKTSYAGYGSFKSGKITDSWGNETTISGLGLVEAAYPPYKYPSRGTYSYIYNNWSSLTQVPGAVQGYEFHEYAWLTGWPGEYSWQAKTSGNPQVATDPVSMADGYAAAYYPRPDLASTQAWRSRDSNKIEYDEYFMYGFVATVARQAYYEFWSNYVTRRSNQYQEFIKSFQSYRIFQLSQNNNISGFENQKTFLKGNYSNINDLTTSDISGVSLAMQEFGNDLIRTGKAINLSYIHVFGLPSRLLINLQNHNALTEALRLALLISGLTAIELENILLPVYTPSTEQEKRVYQSLLLIKGVDLVEICTIINCATAGLTTLADLIDPKKLFPNSYPSLTVPEYNINTLSAKNYDFIYIGGNVNIRVRNWGDYLSGILPGDLAVACGAFMATMNQIKNIRQMDVEKFAQVVANLEATGKNLRLITGTAGVPGNIGAANAELEQIALGSGPGGNYRFCDFLGAMAGQPYITYYEKIYGLLEELQTTQLQSIYYQLYQYSLSGSFTSSTIQALIDSANAEILSIQTANPGKVAELNYWWDKVGEQLWKEQRAIPLSIPQNTAIYAGASKFDITSFVAALNDYSLDTGPTNVSGILESIADTNSLGGQSIIGALREARNGARLMNTGGVLDNAIPQQKQICTATAIVSGGSITSIVLNGNYSGYTIGSPPTVTVVPQVGVFGAGSFTATALNISTTCTFITPIIDFPEIVQVKSGWGCSLGRVATATVNGSNYEITVADSCFVNGLTYTFTSPIQTAGQNGTAVAIVDSTGTLARIEITNPGQGYIIPPTIIFDCPPSPARLGGPVVQGSFAGSPYTGQDPVPDNLIAPPGASYTVGEAVDTVTECNCDCWKN